MSARTGKTSGALGNYFIFNEPSDAKSAYIHAESLLVRTASLGAHHFSKVFQLKITSLRIAVIRYRLRPSRNPNLELPMKKLILISILTMAVGNTYAFATPTVVLQRIHKGGSMAPGVCTVTSAMLSGAELQNAQAAIAVASKAVQIGVISSPNVDAGITRYVAYPINGRAFTLKMIDTRTVRTLLSPKTAKLVNLTDRLCQ
jgi:hypothetical protein